MGIAAAYTALAAGHIYLVTLNDERGHRILHSLFAVGWLFLASGRMVVAVCGVALLCMRISWVIGRLRRRRSGLLSQSQLGGVAASADETTRR